MSRRTTKKSPLEAAREALDLLDTHIQEDRHGDIDGVDTVDAGLRAMASALTELHQIPVPEGLQALQIAEVLDFLVAQKRAPTDAPGRAMELLSHIVDATYHGLSDEALERANKVREELREILNALIREQEARDGT